MRRIIISFISAAAATLLCPALPASGQGTSNPTSHGDAAEAAKVVVLGDSYSTFEGCIPQGYACWYFKDKSKGNDVHSADQTWWSLLCRQKGYKLLLNGSYSGSTIGNTGYRGEDYSDRSFVTRIKTDIVGEDGRPGLCGEVPDLILIFGGTNDDWSGAPLGSVLPADKWKDAELKQSLPATSYMLGYLKERLPDTRIVMIINSDMRADVERGLVKASQTYGVQYVRLYQIDKIYNHPSVAGMHKIAAQVGAAL